MFERRRDSSRRQFPKRTMKLLLYTERLSPRLRYTAGVLFREVVSLDYELTTDRQAFRDWPGPRLNYSGGAISARELRIAPVGLLFEAGIREQAPDTGVDRGLPAGFPVPDPKADYRFDLFAFCFYLLTRYEEYLPFVPDAYGRFPARESLAWRAGFLEQPIVDDWGRQLVADLQALFPDLAVKYPDYRFLPTYDVDLAWAFQGRPLWRSLGAILRRLSRGEWSGLYRQVRVLAGIDADPYDTYQMLDSWHQDLGLPARYFFLLGDLGPLDRNVDPQHPALRELIRRLDVAYGTGLHPSFGSNSAFGRLEMEKERLRDILGRSPGHSRQHFLLIQFPHTYRNLLKLGLLEDYSMGYAAATGFRAGIARPFPWYDLLAEEETPLRIYPFAFMDVSLKHYLGLNPEQAEEHTQMLTAHVRRVGGALITIWHNSSFAAFESWTGWEQAYRRILEQAR